MKWDGDAEKALSKAPFFVRKTIKRRVEAHAAGTGALVVGLAHVRQVRENFLNNMEKEVPGYQLETCFAESGCPNGACFFPGLIHDLEERLKQADLKSHLKSSVKGPLKLHHNFRVVVADCPNACSRPQIADVGLIGAARPRMADSAACTGCGACRDACREMAIELTGSGAKSPVIRMERCLACGLCARACPARTIGIDRVGYRLLVGGKLGRHPQLGREIGLLTDAAGVVSAVGNCLDLYKEHAKGGERFGEMLNRLGESALRKILEIPAAIDLDQGGK